MPPEDLPRRTPWDSAVYGIDTFEIGRVTPEALAHAARTPGHYTVKVDPLASKKALHDAGFYYCDTLLEPHCTAADLVLAVRTVAAGRRYLSPILAERALTGYVEHPGESELDVYETLTNRERLVLQLAAEGKTSAEIATSLFISPRTAETHRANLMRKLGLRSQTDLVRFAIRRGIIAA